MNEFKQALQFVLKWEGFISNDPKDPGGLTIWGISYRSYPDIIIEMEELINKQKKDEAFKIAEKIYYENYWLKAGCDKTTFPLNIIVFDTAVNMGRSMAEKLLNECFSYDADKNLGTHNWRDYLLLRLYTYSKFKQAKLYFRGWANRTLDLYHFIKEKSNEDG